MNKTYVKPTTLTDILVTDVLKTDIELKVTDELAVGTPLILTGTTWQKATELNIATAEKHAILCENATADGIYTVMLIGAVKFVDVHTDIKTAFFKSNLIYQ